MNRINFIKIKIAVVAFFLLLSTLSGAQMVLNTNNNNNGGNLEHLDPMEPIEGMTIEERIDALARELRHERHQRLQERQQILRELQGRKRERAEERKKMAERILQLKVDNCNTSFLFNPCTISGAYMTLIGGFIFRFYYNVKKGEKVAFKILKRTKWGKMTALAFMVSGGGLAGYGLFNAFRELRQQQALEVKLKRVKRADVSGYVSP